MNTVAFTLGALTVIAALAIAVIIWVIVKVLKQQKQISSLEENNVSNIRNINQMYGEISRQVDDRVNDLHRILIDDRKELNTRIDECYSYTDSRIDKSLAKDIKVIKG
jgi:hypothetical protein